MGWTVLSNRRPEVKGVRKGPSLMSCSWPKSGHCLEYLALKTWSVLLPWCQPKNGFQHSHTCSGAGMRNVDRCRLGEPSAHPSCIVSVSSISAPISYLGAGVCVQCRILGWWERHWSRHWCLVVGHTECLFWELPFFFLIWNLRARGILGGWRRGGERWSLRVNKQNHSNALFSSFSLPWPH